MAQMGAPGPDTGNPMQQAREQLEQAEALRQQRKFDRAESICTALLRKYPDYFGALHTLGLIHADREEYRRAVVPLVQAAMLNPRSWMTHTALAGVYLRLDAKEMAAHTLEQARAIKPDEPSILVTLGEIYRGEHEYELARDAFAEALAIEPGMEEAAIGLSWAYSALGDNIKAVEALAPLFKSGTPSLGALTALVSLPASAVNRDVLADLDKLGSPDRSEKTAFETTFAFTRAAALAQAGRHREAWEQATAANRLAFPKVQRDLTTQIGEREARLKWLRENFVKAISGSETQPISLFILGPSRSGKTTMESLVAMLPGVKRGYENPSIENAISRAYQGAGLLTAYWLALLPPQFYPSVREIYAEEIARRGATSCRVFTNTHPANIANAPNLAMILPNARFLFVKRNVDDLTVRIYFRQYERGNPYAYDLNSIRAHLAWYNEMADLMAKKLPDITRVVQYEDMVADPSAALRVAADLCGLPMADVAIPPIGDDRGCAAPYRQFMTA